MNNSSDMIEIACPNCGGIMQRKKSEYFARCSYCNKEVVFDEIKEEAELYGIRKKLKHNERIKKEYNEQYTKFKKWRIVLIVSSIIYFLVCYKGFWGIINYNSTVDAWYIIAGFAMFVIFPIFLSLQYPVYDFHKYKINESLRIKMSVKLYAYMFMLGAAAIVVTVIIKMIIER